MKFRALLPFCFAAVAAVALAQKPAEPSATQSNIAPAPQSNLPPAPQPNIKVQVNEVIVPVTVTDEKGKFVSDLEKSDFKIFDEGKEQTISFFTREHNQPVVVGFLLDLSNASRLHWDKYREAAIELVLNLLPGDPKYSGYLIPYSNDAEVAVDTTSDSEPIVEKMRKLKPGGGAALYDAIYLACTSRKLIKGEPVEPRRIVVIIGDGHDTASKHGLNEVLELAQRNLVTIYGVSTTAFGFANDDEKNLVKLAEDTGGRVEHPLEGVYSDVAGFLSTPSDEGNYALKVGTGGYASALATGMFKSITAVAGEVTTQYILRYTPDVPPDSKGANKTFRNIVVKVKLPNVKVRARKGYYPFLIGSRGEETGR